MTNYLFIHQHAPGQWKQIAAKLAQAPENRVVFLCTHSFNELQGVEYALYEAPTPQYPPDDRLLRTFLKAQKYGEAAARRMKQLKTDGFTPDIICCHPGWGEGMYIRDVYPDVPIISYAETFSHHAIIESYANYQSRMFKTAAPPPISMEGLSLNARMQVRTDHIHMLTAYEQSSHCITPTQWQYRQHPPYIQTKMTVIHEGVDTTTCTPKADMRIQLPSGHILRSGDEVVTYLARNLEPARGFPTFMHALPQILETRPNAHVLIMGGEGISYGVPPKEGGTWKEKFLKEVTFDHSRVHFLGFQPYEYYLELLRISSAHIYLTYPFVLSWSMLEAMACECLIIGSNTGPVSEVIESGKNGLLVDFFSPEALAQQVIEVLERPEEFTHLRKAARQTIVDHYDLNSVCLPRMEAFLEGVTNGVIPDALQHEV